LELVIHTVSVDEMTGIQALERVAATKLMTLKQVERREFEYKRHGTQCLIGNLEVATGKVICPTVQATRTEKDFAEHIARTVASDAAAGWIFILDNLTTHVSESLVRYVAKECGLEEDIGVKGKKGILKSVATRRRFLENKTHRIRFVYIPKHTYWLNQIEIWFSILVRRVIKRGNFTSIKDLRDKILAFIEYFNATRSRESAASCAAEAEAHVLARRDRCSPADVLNRISRPFVANDRRIRDRRDAHG